MSGSTGRAATLGRRALNRATLQRQLLLDRAGMPALDAIERLAAMQGQEPNAPYIGLWARLDGFGHDELTGLLHDRRVVRSTLLRGTQHLASAADYRWLRPLVQPAIDRAWRAAFGRSAAGVDPAELAAAARSLLDGRTLTRPQLGRLLAERFPGRDPLALGWVTQAIVPVVHPPPNGTWRRGGATPFALAEDWPGAPMADAPPAEALVRRYLAAFGPATVADLQTWSGLTHLRGTVERLLPDLRPLRDEHGGELVDLPDAPLPDPDVPAPPRFLPEFDNLLVGHRDRARIVADHHRGRVITGSLVRPTLLVDGFVRGTWAIERAAGGDGALTIDLFEPLSGRDEAGVVEEGAGLLAFAGVGGGTIRFGPLHRGRHRRPV